MPEDKPNLLDLKLRHAMSRKNPAGRALINIGRPQVARDLFENMGQGAGPSLPGRDLFAVMQIRPQAQQASSALKPRQEPESIIPPGFQRVGPVLFDPSGRGYDYETAKKAGMRPQVQEDGKPHWGSVAPIDEKLGIYRVLKGRQHPTFDKAVEGEKQRNAAVVRGKGGFYYSIPEPFGFNIRTKLFPSEEEYFTKNQNVTGMAAEDGKIILNPNTDLSPQELLSVAQNVAKGLKELRLLKKGGK